MSRLGPYQLGPILGQGGMGTVYRARHLQTGAERAVKVLLGAAPGRGAVRFAREAELLARVRHPNVVALHEVGHDGGTAFFAMDLVDGQPLSELLRQGPLPLGQALDLTAQAARGVGALHAAGVVHRDLKSQNILRARDGTAVVIDLGLAVAPDRDARLTATGQLVGTPTSMAPEQLDGRTPTTRTDVHALGLVLFELVTGRGVFDGAGSMHEVVGRILAPERPRPSEVDPRLPARLDGLVARAIAADPAARFPDAVALARALEALARDPGPSAVALRRGRALGLAAAVLLPLLLVGAVLLVALRTRPPAPTPAPAPPPPAQPPPTPTEAPVTEPPVTEAPAIPEEPVVPVATAPAGRPTLHALIESARAAEGMAGVPRFLVGIPHGRAEDGPVAGVFLPGERLLTWTVRTGAVRLRSWGDLLQAGKGTAEDLPLRDVVPVADGALLVGGSSAQGAIEWLGLSSDPTNIGGPGSMTVSGRRGGLPAHLLGAVTPFGDAHLLVIGVQTMTRLQAGSLRPAGQLAAADLLPEGARVTCAASGPAGVAVGLEYPGGEVRRTVAVWERAALAEALAEGEDAALLPPGSRAQPCGSTPTAVRFGPAADPTLLALGTEGGGVSLLRVATGSVARPLVAPDVEGPPRASPLPITGLCFAPDGRTLVTFGADGPRGELRTWEVASGRLLARIRKDDRPPTSVRVSADGHLLAIGTSASGLVELWLFD